MKKPPPCTRASTLVAMYKATSLLNETSRVVGDLSLIEYSFLVRASRSERGVSVKELKEEFSFYLGDATLLTQGLVYRELATLVRNPADRRGLALRVNEKGIMRLTLMDETMVLALLDASESSTQESIESLVEYCQNTLLSSSEKPQVDTLMPGEFMVLLCRYQEALTAASARVGLSSVQSAILMLVDISLKEMTPLDVMNRLTLSESVLLPQFEFLEDRRLLVKEREDALELSKEGLARIDSLSREMSTFLLEFMYDYQKGKEPFFDELFDYCEYLFR